MFYPFPSPLAQVIKRFIMHSKKTAFIVEHDFIMATYMADRVIVYEGEPSKRAFARTPQSLQTGEAPPAPARMRVGMRCCGVADSRSGSPGLRNAEVS